MSFKARLILYGIFGILAAAWLWKVRHTHDVQVAHEIASTVLPADAASKVIVDTKRHVLTTITRDSNGSPRVHRQFLGPAGASITTGKNWRVTIVSPKYGTEITPFLGGSLGTDINVRAVLGLNLFYVTRFEVGGGVLVDSNYKDTRLFLGLSYNPYSSLIVGAGVDNRKVPMLYAALKF